MPRKQARQNAGTQKTAAKKRSRRPTDKQIAHFEREFEADFRAIRKLAPQLTTEECCYLTLNAGLKSFPRALLQVLGIAIKRREDALRPYVQMLRDNLSAFLAKDSPELSAHDRTILCNRVLSRLSKYIGPLEEKAFFFWVYQQLQEVLKLLKAIRLLEVRNPADFAVLYVQGRDALLGGIRTGLAECADLHPDIGDGSRIGDDTSELEQRAWLRVWENLHEWTALGTAAITTRLFAYGEWQARGWKTEKLRERERRRRIEEAMSKCGLLRSAPEDEDEDAEVIAA